MMRKYLLPVLAVIGVVIAVIAVVLDSRRPPPARPAVQPVQAPFGSFVAGAGVIEAGSGNVAVGTPVPGIVTEVYVKWGDQVAPGDRLFKIDDRDLQAQLLPALARKEEAAARLEQAEERLEIAESVHDPRAVSLEEVKGRRSAVAIASASLGAAEAEAKRIRLEIGRRSVRALQAGRVLQIGVRPGEFAPTGALAAPLMLLGSERRFLLRVDIDEYDAWRVRADAPAVAFLRGNPKLRTPLRFERIEPYVVPKTSLTGSSTERVDTRVLQVIYSFAPAELPESYVGQQMDVFIKAPPPAQGAPPPRSGRGGGKGGAP